MPAPFQLTPEQLRKQEDRKAAKLAKKVANASNRDVAKEEAEETERSRFMKRSWIDVGNGSQGGNTISMTSWNMLAQTLVRRDLFPGSDCLRWADRKSMMVSEMRYYDSDIFVLQEVDRLDAFLPLIPTHQAVQTRGPGKQHGLVVLYRSAKYRVNAHKTIYLDDELLRDALDGSQSTGEKRTRRAGTRQTKNVGLIVALEDVEGGAGIVVATTHLFWHPKFAYERTRQILLLVNAIYGFQHEQQVTQWPAFLTGDLNTQPSEPTYRLLTAPNDPLPQFMVDDINFSRIVHTSVDNIAPDTTDSTSAGVNDEDSEGEDEGEGNEPEGEELPDNHERSIKNTRRCTPADGLLTPDELSNLANKILNGKAVISAYGSGGWQNKVEASRVETFGGRRDQAVDGSEEKVGDKEPAWTCFTPLWRLTLDYIFLLPSRDNATPELKIEKLLAPAIAADLEPGLPRKGICASDHLVIGAQYSIA